MTVRRVRELGDWRRLSYWKKIKRKKKAAANREKWVVWVDTTLSRIRLATLARPFVPFGILQALIAIRVSAGQLTITDNSQWQYDRIYLALSWLPYALR